MTLLQRWTTAVALGLTSIAGAQEPVGEPEGDLFVSSTPQGAAIHVDGTDTGQVTPAMLTLAAGSHAVEVTDACGSATSDVEVRAGLVARVELAVERPAGTLALRTEPAGAEARLDGELLGTTPLDHPYAGCLDGEVTLKAPGFQEQVVPLDLTGGQDRELLVMLQPIGAGTLVVRVQPLTATVTVEGHDPVEGPITLDPIDAGSYAVTAGARGYATKRAEVEVAGGEVTRLDWTLRSRRPARIVWAGTTSAAAAGFAAVAVQQAAAAGRSERARSTLTSPSDVERWEIRVVAPYRARAATAAVIAGAFAATGAALWLTLPAPGQPVAGGLRGTW